MTDVRTSTKPAETKPALERWFLAFRCGIGWHDHRWSFVVDGDCGQTSTCGDCGGTYTRDKGRPAPAEIVAGLTHAINTISNGGMRTRGVASSIEYVIVAKTLG